MLDGTLSSRNCGVALTINTTMTHVEKLNAKAINYTLMMTAVSFLQASSIWICVYSVPVMSWGFDISYSRALLGFQTPLIFRGSEHNE